MSGLLFAKNDVHQFGNIRDRQITIAIHVTPQDVLFRHLFCAENDVHQYGYIRDSQCTITIHVAKNHALIPHGTNDKAFTTVEIGDAASAVCSHDHAISIQRGVAVVRL